MNKRLFRIKSEGLLAGVCAGLGQYLGIDPTIVRIFFILWVVVGSFGSLAYFVLWVLMPPEQAQKEHFQIEDLGSRFRLIGYDIRDTMRSPHPQLVTYAGVGLIGMGVMYIIREFAWQYFTWWNPDLVWPFFLIVAGVVVLIKVAVNKK